MFRETYYEKFPQSFFNRNFVKFVGDAVKYRDI